MIEQTYKLKAICDYHDLSDEHLEHSTRVEEMPTKLGSIDMLRMAGWKVSRAGMALCPYCHKKGRKLTKA